MALTRSTNTGHYICASTDTKPTGVDIGSILWEYDTSKTYSTYDGTNWVLYPYL